MNDSNLNFWSLIIIILMFAVTSGTSVLIYNENHNLKTEILILRSSLESNPEYLFSTNLSEGVSGRYFLNSQNIVLYTKSESPYLVGLNAHHEIGHYIWYKFLSDNLRTEYSDIFYNATEYISDYAETNEFEDFAETVSESVIISIDYSKIPEDRRDFVKKYVEWFVVT